MIKVNRETQYKAYRSLVDAFELLQVIPTTRLDIFSQLYTTRDMVDFSRRYIQELSIQIVELEARKRNLYESR